MHDGTASHGVTSLPLDRSHYLPLDASNDASQAGAIPNEYGQHIHGEREKNHPLEKLHGVTAIPSAILFTDAFLIMPFSSA